MDWNNDGKHDLLAGNGLGQVTIFLNTNNNSAPVLDGGVKVYAGAGWLDVGNRAASDVTDWNGDGKKDLVIGNLDGNIKIYLNEGTDASPVYNSGTNLTLSGGAVFDVGSRSAPRVVDWNHDGKQDLMVGEYYGYIYYLQNVGTNSAPVFNSAEQLLLADGTALRYIDSELPATPRSRFDVVDWDGNGYSDLIVGGKDGRLMIYGAAPEPLSAVLFIIGGGVMGLRGLRKGLRKDKHNTL
ncbi:MAG: VCBS repeat-containing protein [Nitrospirae bacterium]|nr:VCBS repeat-containing protein [Nitrospirota bacterium]